MYTCRYEKQGAPFLELKKKDNSRFWIFVYYIPRNLLWEVFVDFFQPAVSQPCSFLNFNLNDSLLAQLHRKLVLK